MMRVLLSLGLCLTLFPFRVSASEDPQDLNEYCTACHDDIHENLLKGFHRGSFEQKIEKGYVGCQACHWPGDEHVDDPSQPMFSFRDQPAAEQSARCLACHQKTGVGQNIHQRSGVACTRCHISGHGDDVDVRRRLVRDADPELCFKCHARQKAQMQLPFRHRTLDGTTVCADCHNPHDRLPRNAVRLRGNQYCFKCHTDKQGPFMYEHLSSTVTGCESCHQPHGSTNPKLLNRSEIRFLCLECHGNTPSFHDLSQQRFQNCTLCHNAIHGSHVNRLFLR